MQVADREEVIHLMMHPYISYWNVLGLIPAEGQGIFPSISLCMLQLIFMSVHFCFSFV